MDRSYQPFLKGNYTQKRKFCYDLLTLDQTLTTMQLARLDWPQLDTITIIYQYTKVHLAH